MNHELNILTTFVAGLAGALVFGYTASRLKLSPIVGYLLAGMLIGPHTPGLVVERGVAEQFAEIGVILLLFGTGLRFNLSELAAVWKIALPGALIQSTLSTLGLAALLRLEGWPWTSGIILGMAVSVASTVVMALMLDEHHDLHAPIGHIAIGWTVVEDIITVALLLILPIWFGPDAGARSGIGPVLGLAAAKLAGLAVLVAVLGRWVIPPALERIARTRLRELFTLAVLVLAIGIAVGSAKGFGVSIALGAFLAGLAVGRSEFAARAASDAVPMRDAFSVLFFVAAGMLFSPSSLIREPMTVATVAFVVILGKPLIALATVRLLGASPAVAFPVGAAFSQVGEFSFILGTVALGLGLIPETGWNALVAASMISISLNPFIYKLFKGLPARMAGRTPAAPAPPAPVDPDHCILVGYGPVGRIVHRVLEEQGRAVTVIDLNLDTVRELRASGFIAMYGDVLRQGTLEEAGVARAGSLILTADVDGAAEVIRRSRCLNPGIRILARCTHLRDAEGLRSAGADVVAAGEAEVGVTLAEAVSGEGQVCTEAVAKKREIMRNILYNRPEEE
ncbi:MAG: cation:proton antiporter [bacterium]|nr:cation:proton antiporter [bacterium]